MICSNEVLEHRIATRMSDDVRIVQQRRVAHSMKDRFKKGVGPGEGDRDRPEDSEPPSDDLPSAKRSGEALARETTQNG